MVKIKELNIAANIAFSPADITKIYLACGTPSQQIDTSNNVSQLQVLFLFILH